MLTTIPATAHTVVRRSGEILFHITKNAIHNIDRIAREAAAQREPVRNILILLPLPLILLGVMLAFFIRSFRRPEKVLKPKTVEQLEARGRSTRGYLRFWRIEMMLVMLFVIAFSVFIVTSMTLGAIDGYTPADDAIKAQNGFFMYAIIAYAIALGVVAYFGRGIYFGKWNVRFIAIPQGGPPNPRSGSGYTM